MEVEQAQPAGQHPQQGDEYASPALPAHHGQFGAGYPLGEMSEGDSIPGGPKLHRTPVTVRTATQPRSARGTPHSSNPRSVHSGPQQHLLQPHATPGTYGTRGSHRLARTPGSMRPAAAAYPVESGLTGGNQVRCLLLLHRCCCHIAAVCHFAEAVPSLLLPPCCCCSSAAAVSGVLQCNVSALVCLHHTSHTAACLCVCAVLLTDPGRPQAGPHSPGPHPRHWLPAGPGFSCGAAPTRQRPRRALCCWPRLSFGGAVPWERSGAAPWWNDAAACAAAHDVSGALRARSGCLVSVLSDWTQVAPPSSLPLLSAFCSAPALCPLSSLHQPTKHFLWPWPWPSCSSCPSDPAPVLYCTAAGLCQAGRGPVP
jgi:hypothetical protein